MNICSSSRQITRFFVSSGSSSFLTFVFLGYCSHYNGYKCCHLQEEFIHCDPFLQPPNSAPESSQLISPKLPTSNDSAPFAASSSPDVITSPISSPSFVPFDPPILPIAHVSNHMHALVSSQVPSTFAKPSFTCWYVPSSIDSSLIPVNTISKSSNHVPSSSIPRSRPPPINIHHMQTI